jgi:acetyl-CoA acetyltransferase
MANAAAAIATGLADCVVVYRALAQGQFGRFGQGARVRTISGDAALSIPYGQMSPAQWYAPKTMRFMWEHDIGQEALRAIALASYHHAQANPRAVMYGRPLDEAGYDGSRWITEPFHLFDCCQENDGAAAIILVAAERARDLKQTPAYVLGAGIGAGYRVHSTPAGFATPDLASSHFKTVAKTMYEMAGVGPKDVDVVQSYENFTGGVLMSLVEHGFFAPEDAMDILTLDNLIAPGGKLPLNTSGGNLAECYMHGLELQIEAVRQVRGQSTAQVPRVDVSLAAAGPMVTPVSTILFGSQAAL